jgi:glutathione S-transferase
MLKIYGLYRSRTFRVIWLCKESAIPYEHVNVTIHGDNPTCKEDWFRKLNPSARVPTIDDDGVVLSESSAINLYLAKKYASPLYPRTPAGEARMLQWAFYICNDVEQPMVTVYQHRLTLPAEKRNPALADECARVLDTKLAVLEGELGNAPFFGGKQWDMSDFMIASVLYTVSAMKYDLSKFPKLDAWLKASVERPAAKEARKLRE